MSILIESADAKTSVKAVEVAVSSISYFGASEVYSSESFNILLELREGSSDPNPYSIRKSNGSVVKRSYTLKYTPDHLDQEHFDILYDSIQKDENDAIISITDGLAEFNSSGDLNLLLEKTIKVGRGKSAAEETLVYGKGDFIVT